MPAVVVATDKFADLRLAIVPHPLGGIETHQVLDLVEAAVEQVMKGIRRA